MRHPDLQLVRQAIKQRAVRGMGDDGWTVFFVAGAGDRSAQGMRQQLHAIADAEYGLSALQKRARQPGRIHIVGAARSAAEDIAGWVMLLK